MNKPYRLLLTLGLSLSLLAAPAAAAEVRPAVSSQAIVLIDNGNSERFDVPMYFIEGNNYIKLRDLAALLDKTGVPFECAWNSERETVELTRGMAYTKTGGEWTALADNPEVKASSANVLLDGEPVSLTGYNLNNNNFYKLRDLGQALDIAVYWDYTAEQAVVNAGATHAEAPALEEATKESELSGAPLLPEPETPLDPPAVSDPSAGLEPPAVLDPSAGLEPPAESEPSPAEPAAGLLANGKEITDENIREILNALRADYPEGTVWNLGTHYSSEGLKFRGVGCAAFAAMCTDKVWGDNPGTRYDGFESIRVGDILRVKYDSHSVVVLEVLPDSVIVTEGNYQGIVHWDRELTRAYLEGGNFFGTTRYPG